jgi:hypothetical protein
MLIRPFMRSRPSLTTEEVPERYEDGTFSTPTLTQNWGGYVDIAAGQYNLISAQYVLGTCTTGTPPSSSTWYRSTLATQVPSSMAVWVGLDGYGSGSVEQCGFQVLDTTPGVSGGMNTSTWLEMYPAYPELWSPANYPVSFGDTVINEVQFDGTYFILTNSNLTKGWTYSARKGANGAMVDEGQPLKRTCSEVIIECQVYGMPLINFGTYTFTGIQGMSSSPIGVQIYNGATTGQWNSTNSAYASDSFAMTWNNY